MPDEDIETTDSLNGATEEVDNTPAVEETDVESQTEDESPEYTETEKKLYARAKKAEAEAKALRAKTQQPSKPESTPSETGSLTIRDINAIKDLEVEDGEWLATYAKNMSMSLPDARKDKAAQAYLAVRAEERRTAAATSTGTARRGTSKVSDDALLDRANKGDIPEDDDSMMRIAQARLKKMSK